ncbi:MAG: hypothetical protein ACJ8D4_24185 [Xanthobacteraceae bacterium]
MALNEARFFQALAQRDHEVCVHAKSIGAKIADHRHCRLLPAHRERPRRRDATEKRDECAAFHSITSSARASSIDGGEVDRADRIGLADLSGWKRNHLTDHLPVLRRN